MRTSHMPSRHSSQRRFLLGLLVSGGLVAWLALSFDWSQVWAAMAQTRIGPVLLAAALFSLALVTRARAWQVLLGEGVPFPPVFWSLMVGFLFTTLLPFRLGEAVRVVALRKTADVPWSLGISSVLVSRLVDAMLLAFVVLALAPTVLQGPALLQQPLVWMLVAGLALLVVGWGLRQRERMRAWLHRRMGTRSRWRPWLQRFDGLMQALSPLEDPGTWWRFLGWKVLTWSLIALEHYLLLRIWFPQATLLWAYWVVAVASLGVALPSAPGHVGTVQAGMLAALWPLGVDPNQALALSLVKHGVYLGVTTVLGFMGLFYTGWTWTAQDGVGERQIPEERTSQISPADPV